MSVERKSPIAELPESAKFFDFESRPIAVLSEPDRYGCWAFDPVKRPFNLSRVDSDADPCSRERAEELWSVWDKRKPGASSAA